MTGPAANPSGVSRRSRARHRTQSARRSVLGAVGAGAALVAVAFVMHGLRRSADSAIEDSQASGPQLLVEGDVATPGPVPYLDGARICDVLRHAGVAETESIEALCELPAAPWTRVRYGEGELLIVPLTPPERFAMGGKLDANAATAAELTDVPGLSDTLARRVVEEREQGPYCDLEALTRVSGIGARKLALMRPFLLVEPEPVGCAPSP